MLTDAQIGSNLARLRGEMSQKELAEAMRKRGFKWSQATVWSVEKGERPLRLTEADALGEIFNTFADIRLRAAPGVDEVYSFATRLAEAHEAVLTAMREFDELRLGMAVAADRVSADAWDGFARTAARDWIFTTIPDIVDEYFTRRAADAAAQTLLSGLSEGDYAAMDERQRGTYLGALNEASEAAENRWRLVDGEHQAEA